MFAATAADVDHVVVGGEVIVRDGAHVRSTSPATCAAPWRPCDDHRARPHRRPGHERRRQRLVIGRRCARHRSPTPTSCSTATSIVDVGTGRAPAADRRIDAGGRCVLPGFVDSHTHLVFAGDRSEEFAARMAGRPYEAGGINVTVGATRAASDATLRSLAAHASRRGTPAPASRRSRSSRATASRRSTRPGASGSPASSPARRRSSARTSCRPSTPIAPTTTSSTCAARCSRRARPHARWIDAFCETGAFDADQCRAVLEAGRAAGLGLRLHANQLGPGPGRRPRRRDGLRLGRSLHVPHRRRRRGAGGRIDRGDVPAGDRLLDPPAVPRRPPRDRRRRHGRASRPTATRARATRRRCRSASRSPCATCT